MTIGFRSRFAALALGLGLLCPALTLGADDDPLPDVKSRLAIEAQRVEKEFKDGRAEAYRLMRAASPNTVEAAARLHTVLTLLQADTALTPARREQLIVTIKWDLDKVRELAADRRRSVAVTDELTRSIRTDIRRADLERRTTDTRRTISEADRIITSRGTAVADSRASRREFSDRYLRVGKSVEDSAMLPKGDIEFPPADKWIPLSKRRSPAANLTPQEKAVFRALESTIGVDLPEGTTFAQAIDYIEKLTGQSIVLDKAGLNDAGVTEEGTQLKLRMKGTTRSVLKRMLSDLNLAYVVKNGQINITSIERARAETTIRTYYLGDLAGTVGVGLGPVLGQIQMAETVSRIITLITQTVEPQSWQVNNPDAAGTIVFEPISMSLIIKQTAEIHFMMGGGH